MDVTIRLSCAAAYDVRAKNCFDAIQMSLQTKETLRIAWLRRTPECFIT
jgi:hypothetical protein